MKRILLILLLLPLLQTGASAQSIGERAASFGGSAELEKLLPEEARKITGSLDASGVYDSEGALKRLYDKLLYDFENNLHEPLREMIGMLLISFLCALSATLCGDKTAVDYISVAGVCAIASLTLSGVDNLTGEALDTLAQMDSYSKAALPAVFSMAAAGGAPVSASARYAIVSVGLSLIMDAAQGLILPLIYAFLCFSLSRALFDTPILKSCQYLARWLATVSLTAFTLVFSAFVSISGAVTGSVDALAVKTARTVIANTLPVVGGMISDAASTVLAAANMIKSSSGALSLVAICALCGGPFVVLTIRFLLFRMAAAACEMIPGSRISGFIKDLSTAISLLLGLLGSMCIMLFVSFMSAIKAVGG